ncbi:hypothetical protein IFR05_003985 [Cadophora sp. M221]|nr:hypothetical protein IFR05_003985 [Cadophora sp. M221]
MSASVVENLANNRWIITSNLPTTHAVEPPSSSSGPIPVANPLECYLSSSLRPSIELSYCISAKPSVQLPPQIAAFYCLIKQLVAHDPAQRLPAFVILQHHWLTGRSCQSAIPEASCEDAGALSTRSSTAPANAPRISSKTRPQNVTPPSGRVEDWQIAPTRNPSPQSPDREKDQTTILDDNASLDSGEGEKTQKWSVIRDTDRGTWEYVRCFV